MSTERGAIPASRTRDEDSLLPEGVTHYGWAPVFVSLALRMLWSLGAEPVVKECMRRDPRLLQQIRAVSTAVSAAGKRVLDAGLYEDGLESVTTYTPEETWTFALAFDVIALIGALDGLPGQQRARVAKTLQSVDVTVRRPDWKKAMKAAGAGPVSLRELRARVPHHGYPFG